MSGRPWAEWELQFLRDEYGTSLVRDIAAALGRGIDAVRARILALGLKCRTRWTSELDEVLTLMFPDTSAPDIGELIGATAAAVRMRGTQLGLHKRPGFVAECSRRTTLARSPFTAEVAEVIELLYPDTLTQYVADFIGMPLARVHAYAHQQGWKKTPEFVRETARERSGPTHAMARHWFPKGHVPANKGMKGYDPGGRSHETRFKKGSRPQTWKPVGSLRINADGYLDRKITDTGYPPDDWKAVHRLVWIEANGPIPAGHLIRFLPGRRTTDVENITLDAIECITLAENGRRNSFRNNYPPDVVKLIQTRGHMQRMINKRERALTEDRT